MDGSGFPELVRDMADWSWLGPSGFVYVSLGGRVCRQQLPPSQLRRPVLCQEGRESWHSYCSLAQMPVCLHHPAPSSGLPLLTRQVWPGGGQAGVQDA